jgi:hypothetical protein
MNTWLKLKTKPFPDFQEAEKFVRHFKSINPECKYKAGVADGDIVVFVISENAKSGTHR